jgi:hypothetical protein
MFHRCNKVAREHEACYHGFVILDGRKAFGMKKNKQASPVNPFSPAEQRAARSERVRVFEAEPYGWIAFSESSAERNYHLYLNPETRHLVCTCADFIYRGNDFLYECKHISATLKFIARQYLAQEYVEKRRRAA